MASRMAPGLHPLLQPRPKCPAQVLFRAPLGLWPSLVHSLGSGGGALEAGLHTRPRLGAFQASVCLQISAGLPTCTVPVPSSVVLPPILPRMF